MSTESATPVARRRLWWWIAGGGAAVVVAVVLVVVLVVAPGTGGAGAGTPSAAGDRAGGAEEMPDLIGLGAQEAVDALDRAGLAVSRIRYRHDPQRVGSVLGQSVAAGTALDAAPPVSLEVAIDLPRPVVTSPIALETVSFGHPSPSLEWSGQGSPVNRWRVTLYVETCAPDEPRWQLCTFSEPEPGNVTIVADATSFRPDPALASRLPRAATGWIGWRVEPLDHFYQPGPASELAVYRIHLRPELDQP